MHEPRGSFRVAVAAAAVVVEMLHCACTFLSLLVSNVPQPVPLLRRDVWGDTLVGRYYLKWLAKSVIEKIFDPSTGATYYFNTYTGTSSWTKPALLGDDDIELTPRSKAKVSLLVLHDALRM